MQQLLDAPRSDWDAVTPPPKTTTGVQMVDYMRRIHWWVRLFGVLALAGAALSALGMVAFIVMLAGR